MKNIGTTVRMISLFNFTLNIFFKASQILLLMVTITRFKYKSSSILSTEYTSSKFNQNRCRNSVESVWRSWKVSDKSRGVLRIRLIFQVEFSLSWTWMWYRAELGRTSYSTARHYFDHTIALLSRRLWRTRFSMFAEGAWGWKRVERLERGRRWRQEGVVYHSTEACSHQDAAWLTKIPRI